MGQERAGLTRWTIPEIEISQSVQLPPDGIGYANFRAGGFIVVFEQLASELVPALERDR